MVVGVDLPCIWSVTKGANLCRLITWNVLAADHILHSAILLLSSCIAPGLGPVYWPDRIYVSKQTRKRLMRQE